MGSIIDAFNFVYTKYSIKSTTCLNITRCINLSINDCLKFASKISSRSEINNKITDIKVILTLQKCKNR